MAKAKKLKIIPLGGLNEIGKNLTVFEFGKDIVILDCGIAFPDEEMLGVDLVIPDFSSLVCKCRFSSNHSFVAYITLVAVT